jgi:hypothetical protein
VITDDEIMRLFELADPARDDDGVRTVDGAGYLDALRTRSYDMQLIDTTEAPTKSPGNNRWVLGAIAAAAIVLIVAGVMILTREGGEEVPASPPTTVPVIPTTAVEQSAGQSVEEAIALVRGFYDARNAYDSGAAMSFLADDATVHAWSQGTALPRRIESPEAFRLQTESAAATNAKSLLGDCTRVEAQGPGIAIRCPLDYQELRSDELGIGPFAGTSTRVVVVDGKITSIAETGEAEGFAQQMWDPFGAWMQARHPNDVAVMFADDTPTEESIPLWEQRSREWVEARLSAEQLATEFLEAFAAFDAEAAGAYLATGASTERIIDQEIADYRDAIALYQAWGYEQDLGACRQFGATATGLEVRCPFAYQLMGSRELGFGPFDGSYFSVTVDDESGMITEVTSTTSSAAFARQVLDPFTDWLTTTHPDATELMTVDGHPSLTPESLALWQQRWREYGDYVFGTTPATTTA